MVFLHLSDIHFQKKISDTTFDLDRYLRKEVERDVIAMAKRLGNINGILITGDIAFSGLPEEYEKAAKWLETLCKLINCKPENVWPVPGNHDVNRSIIDKSYLLKSSHEKLRSANTHQEIDAQIQSCFFEDQEGASLLFKPIQAYKNFAEKYEGDFRESNALFWESDLVLNDGSTLRLRGLNSTLVSDVNDDDEGNKLFLGSVQASLLWEQGVEYLTLCHHPPDWLKDHDQVEDKLLTGAKIQLFGHKHTQTLRIIDGKSILLVSGAAHPARTNMTWQPRYNILSVQVNGNSKCRQLVVTIYPRIWGAAKDQKFIADPQLDGKDFEQYQIPLDDWEQARGDGTSIVENQHRTEGIGTTEDKRKPNSIINKGETTMNPARTLAYRFLSLPYHTRIKLAVDLELLRDEDKDLQGIDLFKQIFRRAKEMDQISKLRESVEEKYGEKR